MAHSLLVFLFVIIIIQKCKSLDIDNDLNKNSSSTEAGNKSDRILSRKQRFIAFPKGSTFSVAVCMTVGTIGNPNVNYLSLGMNWGIAYELPNIKWVLENVHGFPNKTATPEPIVKRRHRRDLYQKLELLIDGCIGAEVSLQLQQFIQSGISRRFVFHCSFGLKAMLCWKYNHGNILMILFGILFIIEEKMKLSEALDLMYSFDKGYSGSGLSMPPLANVDTGYNDNDARSVIHRRAKRYVAFPEGSSFTCAVCFTVGVVGSPSFNYLSYGLNWGIAYDLPNETWIIDHLHGFGSTRQPPPPLAVLKRRNRRSLYHSIENLIDRMGYSGRDCVLRALCESRQFFRSEKLGMIPELIRTIFSLPKARLFTREIEEHSDIQHYNNAYFSDEDEDCEYRYPCSFSLLELAMGKYSEPSEDFYGD